MSFISIWVHCVWTTKNRIPYLSDQVLNKVIYHIRENARCKRIYIDQINGYHEHLHALISLGGSQSISDIMQNIKGESSHWINKNKFASQRFEWQDDYYAVSVAMDHFYNLRDYIRNQSLHHHKISFQDELDKLLEEYRLEKFGD